MVGTEKLNETQLERFRTQQQNILQEMNTLQQPKAVVAGRISR